MVAEAFSAADTTFQDRILQGVSRTFALTIPTLPPPLYLAVANAYLLCRIADTIEDDAGFSVEQKLEYSQSFIYILRGQGDIAAANLTITPERQKSSSRPGVATTRSTWPSSWRRCLS